MATLDKNQPYGTVHGLPGVAYDQEGNLFNINETHVDLNGNPVNDSDEEVTTPVAKNKPKTNAKPKANTQSAADAANAKPKANTQSAADAANAIVPSDEGDENAPNEEGSGLV